MKRKKEDSMKQRSFRLPASLIEAALRAAAKERRNLSDFARLALEDRVKKAERRKAA